jgi:hypothetical protein
MDLIVFTHFGKRPRFAGWFVDENVFLFFGWFVEENWVALLPVDFPLFPVIPTPVSYFHTKNGATRSDSHRQYHAETWRDLFSLPSHVLSLYHVSY